MPPIGFLEGLSPQQLIINVGLFIGVIIGVAVNFMKGSRRGEPKLSKDDVIVQAASIADMQPVRQASHHLRELAEIHKAMLVQMERQNQVWTTMLEDMHALRATVADISRENEISNRMRERGAGSRDR